MFLKKGSKELTPVSLIQNLKRTDVINSSIYDIDIKHLKDEQSTGLKTSNRQIRNPKRRCVFLRFCDIRVIHKLHT